MECKLHDYSTEPYEAGEDRVIIERPWNGTGMVNIRIGDWKVKVDANELRHAIQACEK